MLYKSFCFFVRVCAYVCFWFNVFVDVACDVCAALCDMFVGCGLFRAWACVL